MKISRELIRQKFDQYTSDYDMNDTKIKLKHEHTYYVAANAERIAKSLCLSEREIDLAWLLGMFHDIGRFEQLRRYNTFRDNLSINHAELSADILFRDGLAERFLGTDPTDRKLMDQAVRYHNRYRLPDGLDERERMFAQILRDADKIDILRVNCETPRTEIYDLPEDEFLYSDMTDEVYDAVVNGHEVDRQYSRTGVDFIMGHIGFVYGLVYEESRKIILEQGYLLRMLDFESRNKKTKEQIEQVKNAVICYLNN